MNILYLSDTDLDTSASGVAKKILMQTNNWVLKGNHVDILSLESLSWFDSNGKRISPKLIKIQRKKWGIFFHLIYSTYLLKKVLNQKSIEYDIVYMRYRLYFPFFKYIIKKSKQIVEINTNDIEEYKLSSSVLFFYNKIFRSFFLRKVDAFVCVSHELKYIFEKYNKPILVLANGINCKQYDFLQDPSNSRPSLVFIGSPGQKWHGLEKVIWLSEKLPQYDFHIIGTQGVDTKNLFFYGYVEDILAQDIVKTKDVGIGTLSLYINNMEEASPLKTRQYLAHGIPLIYAYKDTDMSENNIFSLKLDNTMNNVYTNVEVIKDFIEQVFKNKEVRYEARKFAEDTLDVSFKEKIRLKFFNQILLK